MRIPNRLLEFSVFVCGAVVMIFELVGSRILAPYFGTSTFVWTALIGIILGSLSLGYYLGGRLADRNPNLKTLSILILVAGILMWTTTIAKDIVLLMLQQSFGLKPGVITASLILFVPVSTLMGMVTPCAVKLKLDDLGRSGATIGNLYAISTIGSIIGTFAAGFYLIPRFGTNLLMTMLSVSLIIISLLLASGHLLKLKASAVAVILLLWGISSPFFTAAYAKIDFVDKDTEYNRVWIYDFTDENGKPAKVMSMSSESHSAMFLESEEPVFEYTKFYHLARHFNPGFMNTLMLGGAGYSFPKDFLRSYPEASIQVVEIDKGVTDLARKYFRLKDDPRLTITHEDGRVFLNKSREKYDVIFGDAFSSHFSIPYQLTTVESVREKYRLLADDGIVILNLISSIEGEKGKFLRAEYATYKQVFPNVLIFPVNHPDDPGIVQNIMLVALKNPAEPVLQSSEPRFQAMLKNLWTKDIGKDVPILTDDHAPVDYYLNKAI